VRRFLYTFVLAAIAVATVPAAAADSAPTPPRRVQQSLLAEILRGFPETEVSGKVGAPSRDWRRGRHPSFAQSTWLYFKLRPRDSVDLVRQQWQADVAEGLLAGISRSRGWRPVTGQTITLVLPNGRERFQSSSIHGTAFRGGIDHASEADADRDLRSSAERVGAAVLSVRFPRPLGRLAAEVVVVTDAPEEFADQSFQRVGSIIEPLRGRAEGVFVEVRATDGRWVVALGRSVRTASGVASINPAFA
jgi:hypothetical protein